MINEKLIQMLQFVVAETGCQVVYAYNNAINGRIWVERGRILDAEFAGLSGLRAVEEMLTNTCLDVARQDWHEAVKVSADVELMPFLISFLVDYENHHGEHLGHSTEDGVFKVATSNVGQLEHFDVYLEVSGSAWDGRRFYLQQGENLVGTSSACAVVLDESTVSRNHCKIVVEKFQVVIEDMGSTNGTKINGVPVVHDRLFNDDKIELGEVTLVYRLALKRSMQTRQDAGDSESGTIWSKEKTAVLASNKTRTIHWQVVKTEEDKEKSRTRESFTKTMTGMLGFK